MKDELQDDLDLLALAEGGESLSPRRRQALEEAIAASAELTERYQATRLVVQFIDELPPDEPSSAFSARLRAKLDAIDDNRAHPWWRRWLDIPSPVWVGGAVAATAALAALYVWAPAAPVGPPARALAQVELLEVAQDLDLLEDFDVIEQLDVLENLELIESLEPGEPG